MFLRADTLGLDGTESLAAVESDAGLLVHLERIRAAGCVELAMSIDSRVAAEDVDITARMVSTGRPHHAYVTPGAMCLAAATRIPKTIPAEVA